VTLVVVDTDVASTLMRRRTSDTLARQLAGHTVAITFVTYGELTKWTLVRHWGPRPATAPARREMAAVLAPASASIFMVAPEEMPAMAAQRGCHATSERRHVIVNVRNGSTIPEVASGDVIETASLIHSGGLIERSARMATAMVRVAHGSLRRTPTAGRVSANNQLGKSEAPTSEATILELASLIMLHSSCRENRVR